jgi:hypothetical protein
MINGESVYKNPLKLYFIATSDRLIQFIQDLLGLDLTGRVFPTGLFEYNVVRDYMRKLNHLKYTSEGRIIDTALQ